MLHVLPVLFLILLLAYIMFKQRKNIEDMHDNIEYLNKIAKENTKKLNCLIEQLKIKENAESMCNK